MKNNEYLTKQAVMKRAQELVDARCTFGSLDASGRLSESNKGDLGQIVEEGWFGYKVNSVSEPDFSEAGVELKVTPYYHTRNGVSAKERLVCNIINYMEEAYKTFEESSFWHKCKCLCLLSYCWERGVPKAEMFADRVTLIEEFPAEDYLIIKQDWEKIIEKIREGKAEQLSEGDTMYLAACTKGATAESSYREQPFSEKKAKQRAYSLKTSYMTRLLRKYIFGEDEDEHIITDWTVLQTVSFDDLVLHKFSEFINKSTKEIAEMLKITWNDVAKKNINAIVVRKILGITGDADKAEEFKNANISVKTIVVNENNLPEQNMSFRCFSFKDIVDEEWENSEVYEQMVASRFLFVVFERNNKKHAPVLKKVFFWNMPVDDVEELHKVWEKTIISIRQGAGLSLVGNRVKNTLPKQTDSYLAHVRPHTKLAAYRFNDGTTIGEPDKYADCLPNGQWMTKQCFWLNKGYLKSVIDAS